MSTPIQYTSPICQQYAPVALSTSHKVLKFLQDSQQKAAAQHGQINPADEQTIIMVKKFIEKIQDPSCPLSIISRCYYNLALIFNNKGQPKEAASLAKSAFKLYSTPNQDTANKSSSSSSSQLDHSRQFSAVQLYLRSLIQSIQIRFYSSNSHGGAAVKPPHMILHGLLEIGWQFLDVIKIYTKHLTTTSPTHSPSQSRDSNLEGYNEYYQYCIYHRYLVSELMSLFNRIMIISQELAKMNYFQSITTSITTTTTSNSSNLYPPQCHFGSPDDKLITLSAFTTNLYTQPSSPFLSISPSSGTTPSLIPQNQALIINPNCNHRDDNNNDIQGNDNHKPSSSVTTLHYNLINFLHTTLTLLLSYSHHPILSTYLTHIAPMLSYLINCSISPPQNQIICQNNTLYLSQQLSLCDRLISSCPQNGPILSQQGDLNLLNNLPPLNSSHATLLSHNLLLKLTGNQLIALIFAIIIGLSIDTLLDPLFLFLQQQHTQLRNPTLISPSTTTTRDRSSLHSIPFPIPTTYPSLFDLKTSQCSLLTPGNLGLTFGIISGIVESFLTHIPKIDTIALSSTFSFSTTHFITLIFNSTLISQAYSTLFQHNTIELIKVMMDLMGQTSLGINNFLLPENFSQIVASQQDSPTPDLQVLLSHFIQNSIQNGSSSNQVQCEMALPLFVSNLFELITTQGLITPFLSPTTQSVSPNPQPTNHPFHPHLISLALTLSNTIGSNQEIYPCGLLINLMYFTSQLLQPIFTLHSTPTLYPISHSYHPLKSIQFNHGDNQNHDQVLQVEVKVTKPRGRKVVVEPSAPSLTDTNSSLDQSPKSKLSILTSTVVQIMTILRENPIMTLSELFFDPEDPILHHIFAFQAHTNTSPLHNPLQWLLYNWLLQYVTIFIHMIELGHDGGIELGCFESLLGYSNHHHINNTTDDLTTSAISTHTMNSFVKTNLLFGYNVISEALEVLKDSISNCSNEGEIKMGRHKGPKRSTKPVPYHRLLINLFSIKLTNITTTLLSRNQFKVPIIDITNVNEWGCVEQDNNWFNNLTNKTTASLSFHTVLKSSKAVAGDILNLFSSLQIEKTTVWFPTEIFSTFFNDDNKKGVSATSTNTTQRGGGREKEFANHTLLPSLNITLDQYDPSIWVTNADLIYNGMIGGDVITGWNESSTPLNKDTPSGNTKKSQKSQKSTLSHSCDSTSSSPYYAQNLTQIHSTLLLENNLIPHHPDPAFQHLASSTTSKKSQLTTDQKQSLGITNDLTNDINPSESSHETNLPSGVYASYGYFSSPRLFDTTHLQPNSTPFLPPLTKQSIDTKSIQSTLDINQVIINPFYSVLSFEHYIAHLTTAGFGILIDAYMILSSTYLQLNTPQKSIGYLTHALIITRRSGDLDGYLMILLKVLEIVLAQHQQFDFVTSLLGQSNIDQQFSPLQPTNSSLENNDFLDPNSTILTANRSELIYTTILRIVNAICAKYSLFSLPPHLTSEFHPIATHLLTNFTNSDVKDSKISPLLSLLETSSNELENGNNHDNNNNNTTIQTKSTTPFPYLYRSSPLHYLNQLISILNLTRLIVTPNSLNSPISFTPPGDHNITSLAVFDRKLIHTRYFLTISSIALLQQLSLSTPTLPNYNSFVTSLCDTNHTLKRGGKTTKATKSSKVMMNENRDEILINNKPLSFLHFTLISTQSQLLHWINAALGSTPLDRTTDIQPVKETKPKGRGTKAIEKVDAFSKQKAMKKLLYQKYPLLKQYDITSFIGELITSKFTQRYGDIEALFNLTWLFGPKAFKNGEMGSNFSNTSHQEGSKLSLNWDNLNSMTQIWPKSLAFATIGHYYNTLALTLKDPIAAKAVIEGIILYQHNRNNTMLKDQSHLDTPEIESNNNNHHHNTIKSQSQLTAQHIIVGLSHMLSINQSFRVQKDLYLGQVLNDSIINHEVTPSNPTPGPNNEPDTNTWLHEIKALLTPGQSGLEDLTNLLGINNNNNNNNNHGDNTTSLIKELCQQLIHSKAPPTNSPSSLLTLLPQWLQLSSLSIQPNPIGSSWFDPNTKGMTINEERNQDSIHPLNTITTSLGHHYLTLSTITPVNHTDHRSIMTFSLPLYPNTNAQQLINYPNTPLTLPQICNEENTNNNNNPTQYHFNQDKPSIWTQLQHAWGVLHEINTHHNSNTKYMQQTPENDAQRAVILPPKFASKLWWEHSYRIEYGLVSFLIHFERFVLGPFAGLLRPSISCQSSAIITSTLVQDFTLTFHNLFGKCVQGKVAKGSSAVGKKRATSAAAKKNIMVEEDNTSQDDGSEMTDQKILVDAIIKTILFSPLYKNTGGLTWSPMSSSSQSSKSTKGGKEQGQGEDDNDLTPSAGPFSIVSAILYTFGFISTPFVTLRHITALLRYLQSKQEQAQESGLKEDFFDIINSPILSPIQHSSFDGDLDPNLVKMNILPINPYSNQYLFDHFMVEKGDNDWFEYLQVQSQEKNFISFLTSPQGYFTPSPSSSNHNSVIKWNPLCFDYIQTNNVLNPDLSTTSSLSSILTQHNLEPVMSDSQFDIFIANTITINPISDSTIDKAVSALLSVTTTNNSNDILSTQSDLLNTTLRSILGDQFGTFISSSRGGSNDHNRVSGLTLIDKIYALLTTFKILTITLQTLYMTPSLTCSMDTSVGTKPLTLLLSKELIQIPFESLPILRWIDLSLSTPISPLAQLSSTSSTQGQNDQSMMGNLGNIAMLEKDCSTGQYSVQQPLEETAFDLLNLVLEKQKLHQDNDLGNSSGQTKKAASQKATTTPETTSKSKGVGKKRGKTAGGNNNNNNSVGPEGSIFVDDEEEGEGNDSNDEQFMDDGYDDDDNNNDDVDGGDVDQGNGKMIKKLSQGEDTTTNQNNNITQAMTHHFRFKSRCMIKSQRTTRVLSLHHLYLVYSQLHCKKASLLSLTTTTPNNPTDEKQPQQSTSMITNTPTEWDSMYQSIGMVCDPRQCVYQLDPSNDLPKTREKFKNFFKFTLRLKGESGKPFNLPTLLKAFGYCHMYIYAGHNNGLQYYDMGDVTQIAAVGYKVLTLAWLLGCSSVKVDVPSIEQQYMQHNYNNLISGPYSDNHHNKNNGQHDETDDQTDHFIIKNDSYRSHYSSIFPPLYHPTTNNQHTHKHTIGSPMLSNSSNVFDPYGSIMGFILAGVPCIVGNLWNVLDQDVDKLTRIVCEQVYYEAYSKSPPGEGKSTQSSNNPSLALSQACLGKLKLCSHQYHHQNSPTSQYRFAGDLSDTNNKSGSNLVYNVHSCDVSTLIGSARQGCVLPYINGAAIVMYGAFVRTDKPTKLGKK